MADMVATHHNGMSVMQGVYVLVNLRIDQIWASRKQGSASAWRWINLARLTARDDRRGL